MQHPPWKLRACGTYLTRPLVVITLYFYKQNTDVDCSCTIHLYAIGKLFEYTNEINPYQCKLTPSHDGGLLRTGTMTRRPCARCLSTHPQFPGLNSESQPSGYRWSIYLFFESSSFMAQKLNFPSILGETTVFVSISGPSLL